MYRILFYDNLNQTKEIDSASTNLPIIWLDGVYSKNQIPFPIQFNKEQLLSADSKEIILEKGQRYIELNLNQLLHIEAIRNGSNLFLENKGFWTTEKSIEIFESDLKGNFFLRANKAHLINLKHFESFITCDAIITLSNKEAIPVDSTKKDQILKFLEGKQLI